MFCKYIKEDYRKFKENMLKAFGKLIFDFLSVHTDRPVHFIDSYW